MAEQRSTTRRYYVLNRQEESWYPVSVVEARSDDAAIREAAKDSDGNPQAGVYVAIPDRSWSPVEITVEQTIQVKLTPATAKESDVRVRATAVDSPGD